MNVGHDEIVQSGLDQNYPNDAYHLMLNFKHDLVSPEFYTAQNSAKKVPRKCRTIFKKILYSGEEEIDWLAVARIPEELDEKLLPYVGLIPAGQLVDFYYKCSFGMEFCEKSFEPLLIALQVEYWKNGNTELLDHLCGAGTQYYLVLRNLLEWHNLDDHYLAKCCMFISMLSQNYKFVEVYTLIHNYLGDMPSELSNLSDWSSKEISNLPDWSINEFIDKDSYLKLYRKYFFYKPTADQCALLGSSAVLFDQCNLKAGNFAHLVASSYNNKIDVGYKSTAITNRLAMQPNLKTKYVRFIIQFPEEAAACTKEELHRFAGRYLVFQVPISQRKLVHIE